MNDNITITIQIGNTDNKLTQQKWSNFIKIIKQTIDIMGIIIHFEGGSSYDKPWQNACWILETKPEIAVNLEITLKDIKQEYNQDSIAFTTGTTEFI